MRARTLHCASIKSQICLRGAFCNGIYESFRDRSSYGYCRYVSAEPQEILNISGASWDGGERLGTRAHCVRVSGSSNAWFSASGSSRLVRFKRGKTKGRGVDRAFLRPKSFEFGASR